MFIPFLAATIVGAGAVKLGAMSAMASVLFLALQALIRMNLIGAGYLLWRRYGKTDAQLRIALPSLAVPIVPYSGHYFRPLSGEIHDPYRQGSYRSGSHRACHHHQRSPGQTLCDPAQRQ